MSSIRMGIFDVPPQDQYASLTCDYDPRSGAPSDKHHVKGTTRSSARPVSRHKVPNSSYDVMTDEPINEDVLILNMCPPFTLRPDANSVLLGAFVSTHVMLVSYRTAVWAGLRGRERMESGLIESGTAPIRDWIAGFAFETHLCQGRSVEDAWCREQART
ncbi:hypothetical protein CBL_12725 [Carabus blaptoides fortunei]